MKTRLLILFGAAALLVSAHLPAKPLSPGSARVSPARGIEQPPDRAGRHVGRPAPATEPGYRSLDGTGNNLADPDMGAVFIPLSRLVAPDYADGISAMAGPQRRGAREISNIVFAQSESRPNAAGASDFLWQWGQFVDHDIDLTDGTDPPEPADIAVPDDDTWFLPGGTIAFNRSIYDHEQSAGAPRQQLNEITAWIDGSMVYGVDAERAMALRTLDGTGRLRTSPGNLLPFNTQGLPNAGGSSAALFLAGDVRANEQVGLTAMHTLFVREHNRLAGELARHHPEWTDSQLYEKARQLVGAEIQVITYREFLPALLGPRALSPYRGYRPGVDARIANVFSAAAYRFGHSALSPTLLRLDARGREIAYGHLPLRNAFFAPRRITDEGGIEPILRGLARQTCQHVDARMVDDVRNFLFGDPRMGGFDLAALNIQRGRDHGLPSYNEVRGQLGLARAVGFSDVSSDPDVQARLARAYDTVDDVDVWVGGLAEDPLPGAHLGELFGVVVKRQFEALRDGDRYWYARVLSPRERKAVEATRLADVIRRNTPIGRELQRDVFHAPAVPSGRPGRPPHR
jgi:peroxidase